MKHDSDVVITGYVRTPVGGFMGGLSSMAAPELGAAVLSELFRRVEVDPGAVDEVIMGNVLQAGVGQNPARQAALAAGIPSSVAAFTVNKVCGSALKSVMLAAQAVRAGDARVVAAGGMESMSRAPFLLHGARRGFKLGHQKMVDHMVSDGLTDAYEKYHMGETAELIHDTYGVTREEADAWAAESHRRAASAWEKGLFSKECVPVKVPGRRGETVVERDEGIRPDTTTETLAKLRPVFRKDGRVTAGNASQISDGAAAVLVARRDAAREMGLKPLFRIAAYATAGLDPKWVMAAPREAVPMVLKKAGWEKESVETYELNEAFAVQSAYLLKALDLPAEKVNMHGGAVAIGHPIGASGARCLVTLLGVMAARGLRRGVVSLCLGGGNAVAMAVESEAD